ncbi:hypothetical protein TIFTF001_008203 [Ficus carica]|uniref:Uncharacterized protein n=1 Tax=Ficus carica TaxID=3494 RepID=A0AA88A819_FICCA|nr:hypothetical protein TIFTF001_008203 [Ficus carica]
MAAATTSSSLSSSRLHNLVPVSAIAAENGRASNGSVSSSATPAQEKGTLVLPQRGIHQIAKQIRVLLHNRNAGRWGRRGPAFAKDVADHGGRLDRHGRRRRLVGPGWLFQLPSRLGLGRGIGKRGKGGVLVLLVFERGGSGGSETHIEIEFLSEVGIHGFLEFKSCQ